LFLFYRSKDPAGIHNDVFKPMRDIHKRSKRYPFYGDLRVTDEYGNYDAAD
jgi:hypothetical protein